MSNADLLGIHVLLTRPRVQAERWAERLRNMGAEVSIASMMEIVPVQQTEQIQAIKNVILDVDLYQKIIFVSQNAVEYGMQWLDNYWPQLPTYVDFFAVGEATSRMLQSMGVNVRDLAQIQEGDMTSEALLQSPSLQHVSGEKILIMRGLGGRTLLGDELVARGARVDYCELYERRLPFQAADELKTALASVDITSTSCSSVIVLQSGEALHSLALSLQQIYSANAQYAALALLVPSVRVAEQAAQLGFTNIHIAANATEASMQQRIKDIRDSWVHK